MRLALSQDELDLLRFSLRCRLSTLTLVLLTAWIVKPFDASAELVLRSLRDYGGNQERRRLLDVLARRFTQWDTLHFLDIAQHGYSTEQQFAFMPGVPVLLRFFGTWSIFVQPKAAITSRTEPYFDAARAVMCTSLLSWAVSCLLPLLLYRLSRQLSLSPRFSKQAAFFWCLSPAPAVLGIPYSEPYFALFSFAGMLFAKRRRYLLATSAFVLSTSFRSMGILNSGFLLWYILWQPTAGSQRLSALLSRLVSTVCMCALIASPLIWQQWHGYKLFCTAASPRPWCSNRLPSIYAFVQGRYWDSGFLLYYTAQQLPNFLLAGPVLIPSLSASWTYLTQRWPHWIDETFPVFSPASPAPRKKEASNASETTRQAGFLSPNLLPFVYLHTATTLLLLLASNVQIALRQACTNPALFWYLAHLAESKSRWIGIWLRYTVVWGAISTVLWTAFYPPA